jgi:HSP20 family protein
MFREMDQAFDEAFRPSQSLVVAERTAPMALWEDADRIYLELEVPGVRQEDLDLTLKDGRLIISGQRKPGRREGKCWYDEQRYGKFERMIALSDTVEVGAIEAELKDGILSLVLPKKPEAKPQRITVRAPETTNQNRIESKDVSDKPTNDS